MEVLPLNNDNITTDGAQDNFESHFIRLETRSISTASVGPQDEIDEEAVGFQRFQKRGDLISKGETTSDPATTANDVGQQVQVEEPPMDFLGSDAIRSIRLALTFLLVLFVPAMLLSVLVASQYRLLLVTLWMILGGLFCALVLFVQSELLQNKARALHPYLNHVADLIEQEVADFQQDWREQVLLLTYGDDAADGNGGNIPFDESDDAESPTAATDVRAPTVQPRRGAKSKVFRVLVSPFVPLLRRGRRRQQRQRNRRGVDDNMSASTGATPQYTPPPVMPVGLDGETELV